MPSFSRHRIILAGLILLSNLALAAPVWQSHTAYLANDIVTFDGRDYKALKSHIANSSWQPNRSPTLWQDIGIASAISANVRPKLVETRFTQAAPIASKAAATGVTAREPVLSPVAAPSVPPTPLSSEANHHVETQPTWGNYTATSTLTPSPSQTAAPSAASTSNTVIVITQKCAAAWSAAIQYAHGDLVSLANRNYQAKAANIDKNPKRISTNFLSANYWRHRKDWKNWNDLGLCSDTVTTANPISTTKPATIPTPTSKPVISTTEPIATPNPIITPTLATPAPVTTPTLEELDTSDPVATEPPVLQPVAPPPPLSIAAQIKQALNLAIQKAREIQGLQTSVMADIYGDASLNLSLNHTKNSSEINRVNSSSAIPLVVADDGSGMAAVSQYGQGRALAYGADVLSWMANQSRETQHYPLFSRAFNWVVSGKAAGPLPATIKFATAGYDAGTVSKLITLQGKTPQAINCDLVAANNTCWQAADVLVFGAGVRADAALADQVRMYQASGKAIIYMHNNWTDSAGGRQVLQGIGMELGGYPGNFYAPTAGFSVNATRTVAEMLQRTDQMAALTNALTLMSVDTVDPSLVIDAASTNAISQLQDEMAWMQRRGIDIFSSPTAELHRLLINWADLYRPSIQYGTIFRTQDPAKFVRTYASDSWVAYNRASTTVSPTGQGDYMPAAAQAIPVSSTSETIEVTIAQSSGMTAIGRGAIPGQPVYIEVVNDGGTSGLNLQTSYVRAYGNPLTDNEKQGYKRPREPQSFPIPLPDSGETVFVTPFGGPLFLNYSGATAGRSVTLKIRGAAKYAHFDFTKPQSEADIADAIAALNRADFGWQTSKFVGGEIQQTIYYAKQAIGNSDPKKVIIDQVKGSLFDSNHIANGYNNMPLSNNVATLCSQFSWDCTGPIHRAPGVQHFIGWIAACGFLCSGNPSDGFSGIGGTGWGHAHELGHNTVQRVMTITFNGKGCVVECNNNVLASIQMMRQFKTLGIDTGHNTDHPGLYQRIVANRNSGTTGEAKVLDMQTNLWDMAKGQDPMRAVHFQLAFLFSKYRALESVPSMEATLDYFTLLTKGDRLVSRAWDSNNKDKYAMGSFSNNTISNPDLLFVLSSKIIGKDLRNIFAMYGMSVSQTALDSVAALGLPLLPEEFYALAPGKHNQVSTGQWLNLANQTPAYPY
ncbi:hypothetical protein HQ393_14185 [Chitinibacter bivalviorum]|uniref:Peptidase M60 domain-containing protein n=1 Tax=Chitinibacter bivalviorum TaxID=2739434 RepID=A0A7H9BMI6_9NEIS|nr:ImpA family metalloprotease [Chitinibacter bivalviorum]QLG89301.1 hypothetical protein HQ393_14185 [Chitinibacter bivalviorum]